MLVLKMRAASAMVILIMFMMALFSAMSSLAATRSFTLEESEQLPIMRAWLDNGTVVNFSSVDEFLDLLYSGGINYDDIVNISVLTIDEYEEYLNENESIENITYHNAVSMFYVNMDEQPENYTGFVIPVNVSEYLYDSRVSRKLSRLLAYGKIQSFTIKYFSNNETVMKEFIGSEYDLIMALYMPVESEDVLNSTVEYLKSLVNESSGKIALVIINTEKNISVMQWNFSTYGDLYLIDDANSTLNDGTNGTYEVFMGINETIVLPLLVIFDDSGLIWYKYVGLPNVDELSVYVSMYLSGRSHSVSIYPILDIVAEEPMADKPCKIIIVVGEGFGEIINITLDYVVLNSVNKTLYKAQNVVVSTETYSYVTQKLDKDAKYLLINATIYSKYGKFSTDTYVFTVKPVKEETPGFPEWVYEAIIWLIVLIIFAIVAGVLYKKYFKE